MKIAIIVPAFNEGMRAVDTVKKILKCTKNSVIVVDDGSVRKNYLLVKNQYKGNDRVIVLRHVVNLGKGAAMKTGAEMAWKIGAEAVIFIDADGQHNPESIKYFEKYLNDFPIVFGFRPMNKKMPFVRKYGNIFAANLIKILFGIKKKDLLSGYLGFRKEVYELIRWNSPRYGIETEMATRAGKNKISFKEIKVDTIYIDKYKGVSILDAFKILLQIPLWYFSK